MLFYYIKINKQLHHVSVLHSFVFKEKETICYQEQNKIKNYIHKSFPNHAWCSAIFPLICLTFYFQRDEQAGFSSCSWKYEMCQPIISLSPSSIPKTWLVHKFPQRDASMCSVLHLFFCLMFSSDRKVILIVMETH